MVNSPVFIFGIPRSGTTWIWSLLASHPNVVQFTYKNTGGSIEAFAPSELESSESGLFIKGFPDPEKILQRYCDHHNGKVVIEKTPGHTLEWFKIHNNFPGSRIIITERDLIDVASSWMNSSQDFFKKMNREQIAREIIRYHSEIIKIQGILGAQLIRFNYELMHKYPLLHLTRIFRELGIAMDGLNRIVEINKGRTFLDNPHAFRKGKVGQAKKELSPDDYHFFKQKFKGLEK